MSNTNIITRTFATLSNTFPVRIVELKGQPWFVAADVCKALGIANTSQAVRPLADDRKSMLNIGLPGRAPLCVNEAGLYDLVLQSRKTEAVEFKEWVTGAVLPAIRKDGAYIMGEEKVATGEMDEDEFVLKAINILQKKVERLKQENKQLAIENEAMSEELNILTVDEYRALSHLYLTQSQRIKLSNYAKSYCLSKGIEVTKQERFLPNLGINTYVNVYTREALDHAALVLGL
jgi:prophage antirepressor-like protein